MLFIPTELLKTDIVLAKYINLIITDDFNLPLLRKGQVLNELFIKKIKFHNVTGVYIENEVTQDIVVNDIINEKLKVAVLCDIKKNFNHFKNNRGEVNIHIVVNIA